MSIKAKNLKKSYVVLNPLGKSEIWKSADFWKMAFDKKHPKNNKDMGYLVSSYDFDSDWRSWENHPYGDELIFCVKGKITFIFKDKKENLTKIELKTGNSIIVPRNTWHTAKVKKPTQCLFITWGFGTQHLESEKKLSKTSKKKKSKSQKALNPKLKSNKNRRTK